MVSIIVFCVFLSLLQIMFAIWIIVLLNEPDVKENKFIWFSMQVFLAALMVNIIATIVVTALLPF